MWFGKQQLKLSKLLLRPVVSKQGKIFQILQSHNCAFSNSEKELIQEKWSIDKSNS